MTTCQLTLPMDVNFGLSSDHHCTCHFGNRLLYAIATHLFDIARCIYAVYSEFYAI